MGFPLHPSDLGRYEGLEGSGAAQSLRTLLRAGGDLV